MNQHTRSPCPGASPSPSCLFPAPTGGAPPGVTVEPELGGGDLPPEDLFHTVLPELHTHSVSHTWLCLLPFADCN